MYIIVVHLEINLTDVVSAVIDCEPFMSIIIIFAVAVVCVAAAPPFQCCPYIWFVSAQTRYAYSPQRGAVESPQLFYFRMMSGKSNH